MKRIPAMMLILLLLPFLASGTEGLDLPALIELRQKADAGIRERTLPDAGGYVEMEDAEEYARNPDAHLGERIRFHGEILTAVNAGGPVFEYLIYPESNAGRLFLVSYTLGADEYLLLPGDSVHVSGVFEGLSPFTEDESPRSGAPRVEADLIIRAEAEKRLPAAAPYSATREDPAPLAVTAVYRGSSYNRYAAFELEAVSAMRGKPALDYAREVSKFNITPLKTQEYLIVHLRVKALSAVSGLAGISPEDFRFVSAEGVAYTNHYLLNNQNPLTDLAPGSGNTAVLSCIIRKDDKAMLVYLPEAPDAVWFDLSARQVKDVGGQVFEPLMENAHDPRVPEMKALLREMGYLETTDTSDRVTRTFKAALAGYQKAMGIQAGSGAEGEAQRLLLSGAYPEEARK